MIRVLHITPDNKFFDGTFTKWETSGMFTNKAILITRKKNHVFKYIQNSEKVQVLWNTKMVRKRLNEDDYDIVFFHSLPPSRYKHIKYIPDDRIVIWWGWGADIYGSMRGLPPLISVNLYKPKTSVFVKKTWTDFRMTAEFLLWKLMTPLTKYRQKKALERIDYYQPVIKKDYELMCRNKNFRAKEFYCMPQKPSFVIEHPKQSDGSILLGNSAAPTNNHLDVLEIVKSFKQESQKVIMPLSYGNKKYRKWLISQIDDPAIIPIYEYMPKTEYFKLLDSCSYAIFGTIRQHSMGNIGYALRKGIKVFLYKDSIVYNYLKEFGYVVYAIEDMSEDSFKTPLSKEEVEQIYAAQIKELNRRMSVFDSFLSDYYSVKHVF